MSHRSTLLVAAGTGSVAVCYGMARFGLGLAAPRIIEDGLASSSVIGLASSLSFLSYVLSCLASGMLLKRGAWRASLVSCVVCVMAGCAAIAAATSTAAFLIGVTVAGASAGFASPAIAYRIARDLPRSAESRSQAIANAGTGLGVGLATTLVLLPWGWRGMFAAAAAIGATTTVLAILSSAGHRADPAAMSDRPASGRRMALPVVLTLLMGAGSAVFWTYGRSLVEQTAHLSAEGSLLFWGTVGVAGILGAVSGDSARRIGVRNSWALCSAALAVSIGGIPFVSNLLVAVALGAVFGASYVILCGVTIVLARNAWPLAVGTGTSLLFATIAVGQAAGAGLAGVAVETMGLPALFLSGGCLVVLGALLAHGWVDRLRESVTVVQRSDQPVDV